MYTQRENIWTFSSLIKNIGNGYVYTLWRLGNGPMIFLSGRDQKKSKEHQNQLNAESVVMKNWKKKELSSKHSHNILGKCAF